MVARIFVICVFLAACQTTPVQGDFCKRNQPLRFTEQQIDNMSDKQVERVLAHNERGQKLCGWRK